MAYETNPSSFGKRSGTPVGTSMGAPILDWVLFFQRQVWNFQKQALRLYGIGGPFDRPSDREPPAGQRTRDVEVIPLGRETLNVGTRVVNQGTTRVRRFVIETPVEEKVPLRQERVVVERRRPVAVSSTGDTLTDKTIEMSDTVEVPVVWTSVELAEEVVVRREVKERVEAVRGVVRHDEVEIQEIDHPFTEEEPRREASTTAAAQGLAKLEATPAGKAQTSPKSGDSKLAAPSQDHRAGREPKPTQEAKAVSSSHPESPQSPKA